jgi:hypothetical protein
VAFEKNLVVYSGNTLIVDFTNDLMRDLTNGRIFNHPKRMF